MIRVLLDEDLDVRLRHHLSGDFHVETVAYRGWKGKENGDLLAAAEAAFDVLVSADSNLRFQRNIANHRLGLVILRPTSKALPRLLELMPQAIEAIRSVAPGKAVEVGPLADRSS